MSENNRLSLAFIAANVAHTRHSPGITLLEPRTHSSLEAFAQGIIENAVKQSESQLLVHGTERVEIGLGEYDSDVNNGLIRMKAAIHAAMRLSGLVPVEVSASVEFEPGYEPGSRRGLSVPAGTLVVSFIGYVSG